MRGQHQTDTSVILFSYPSINAKTAFVARAQSAGWQQGGGLAIVSGEF